MKIHEILTENNQHLDEGPLAKAAGAAALAGLVGVGGMAAKGVSHLSGLNDLTKQEPAKVAQAPAQGKKDLTKIDAKPKVQQKAEPKKAETTSYKPITGSKNEVILAKVAQASGIKGVELAAFMAQMAHESANFSDMVENNPNIKKYLKTKSLGNKNMNDAERFIGRGFIQLTGRWNYEYYGKKIGMDLTSTWSKAHQASKPEVAAKIAVAFWKDRVQGNVDDFTNVKAVTKPINPGLNGLKDRANKFALFTDHMGLDV